MSKIAVVHPNTLVGREVRERLAALPALAGDLRLLSADEDEIGQLAESGGAAAFVGRLEVDAFDGVDLVLFCGPIEADRPWLEKLPARSLAIVASTGAQRSDGASLIAGLAGSHNSGSPVLVPHPAAVGSALLLSRLSPFGVRAASSVALMPVSMQGEPAIEALFEETRKLLAFQSPKGSAASVQRAFNISLAPVDADDVGRQVTDALGARFPLSMQLLQASCFHGIGLSLHAELERSPTVKELRGALAGDARIELPRQSAAVSPVALAGSDRLQVGEIRAGAAPGSFWIWAAYDNVIRGSALTAVELAEELLGGAPRPS